MKEGVVVLANAEAQLSGGSSALTVRIDAVGSSKEGNDSRFNNVSSFHMGKFSVGSEISLQRVTFCFIDHGSFIILHESYSRGMY